MKLRHIALLLATFCSAVALQAEKIVAGPNGGRLLDAEPYKAEFFVTTERKVEITFYDASMKPVAPAAQTATVVAEPNTGKTILALEKTEYGFVSKMALPEGEPYRVVVQTRATPDAKPRNFRIDLNLAMCEECSKREYACVCESH